MSTINILDLPIEIISSITLKISDAKTFGHLLLSNSIFINSITHKELKSKQKNFHKFISQKDKNYESTQQFWLNPKHKYERKYKNFNSQGTILDKIRFRDGKRTGKTQEWFSNKQLKKRAHYIDNQLHGEYKEWSRDGILVIFCHYNNGLLHGGYEEWTCHGEKFLVCDYKEGVLEDGYVLHKGHKFNYGKV